MSQVLAVNAFRRGTGATHVAANLAALLAQAGQRVGLLDADFVAPSQHFLFNVTPDADARLAQRLPVRKIDS